MFEADQAYTTEEVKQKLKLSEIELRTAVKTGKLKPITVNNHSYRFLGEDLLNYLERGT